MISSLMIVIRTIITNLLFLNLLNLCKNILGCDIADEEEDMPLAAASILTADEDTEALVKFTRSAVQPFGLEVDLRVTREQDVLPQMIRKYKNPIFDVTKPLNVEFVGLGENGVDAGGITREYFNLLMEGIKQRSSNGITLLEGNLATSFPGSSPSRSLKRERERPWKTLVMCLPAKKIPQWGSLFLEGLSTQILVNIIWY